MAPAPLDTAMECGEETVLIEGELIEGAGSPKVITSPVFRYNNHETSPPIEDKPASSKVEESSNDVKQVKGADPEEKKLDGESKDDDVLVSEAIEPKPDVPSSAAEDHENVEEKKTDDLDVVEVQEDPFERDFDKNPTVLYALIQKKEWNEATERSRSTPEEARVWVSRKEKDNSLRWRLLPIHAAIVFKAPEAVVEALLAAYPQGAQSKDDQGMLPLHLAFRTGSSEGVVNLLLLAFPRSIDEKDRKGRIPLVLAQASTSPNKEAFMRALERGPTYYAVAAAATERAAVTAEQRAIFDAKLMQLRQSHQLEIAEAKIEAEKARADVEEKLKATEKELLKTQETSQVLVDHVNSLEAQLNSRSDTERFLATKIATLDSSLKDTCKTREETESKLTIENQSLRLDRDSLKAQLASMEAKYEMSQEKLTKSLDLLEKREKDWAKTEEEFSHQMKSTQVDWANAQANCAILEAQLKKKMETEHALATQVSSLAGKLADSAAESRDNSHKHVKRVRDLEDERIVLRESVRDLTKRLAVVARVLEDMTEKHNTIVDESKNHEGIIENALSAHAKIVADAMNQAMQQEIAREERQKMREALNAQDKAVENNEKKSAAIMNAIAVQGQHMENTKKARDEMLLNVKTLGTEIKDVMDTVLDVIPKVQKDDEDLVDEVIKNIIGGPAKEKLAPAVSPQTETTVSLAQASATNGTNDTTETDGSGGAVPTPKVADTSDRITQLRESMDSN